MSTSMPINVHHAIRARLAINMKGRWMRMRSSRSSTVMSSATLRARDRKHPALPTRLRYPGPAGSHTTIAAHSDHCIHCSHSAQREHRHAPPRQVAPAPGVPRPCSPRPGLRQAREKATLRSPSNWQRTPRTGRQAPTSVSSLTDPLLRRAPAHHPRRPSSTSNLDKRVCCGARHPC